MTNSTYHLVCGLEVHAELKTASKMFCSCVNDPFGAAEPNIHTCPVCLGMPGALPVANQKAIEWTIKLGLALGCEINLFSKFDRKHYFYPDLPKGYQISQYDLPFCHDGHLETSQGTVRIRRIHLEEDTGKLQHKTINGQKVSLIDFNRSSVPLVEVVTEADIISPEQAKEYSKKLRQIMRQLQISDCDMEQGTMRLEANISLSPNPQAAADDELPAYKVEVKNINSFRFLEQAIQFEMQRQTLVLDAGEMPTQETRGWDADHNTTFPQRVKEDAEDYRYFPDPDLPPIQLDAAQIETWRSELPELPAARVARWSNKFGVEPKYGQLLSEELGRESFFEDIFTRLITIKADPNVWANFYSNKKITVKSHENIDDLASKFVEMTKVDEMSGVELSPIIDQVIGEFPQEYENFKSGKTALINFLIGQTLKKLGKKVDVGRVKQAWEAKL